VLLDLYSRRVVGWSMGPTLERTLCLDALHMALRTRQPAPGLVHHTDRGSQYASQDYQKRLGDWGLVGSMSGKGDCWDNAVAESFFATLKGELVERQVFLTRAQARQQIFEYIEVFYNRHRRHSSLGYRTPVEYESLYKPAVAAA
jgi:putative transposase